MSTRKTKAAPDLAALIGSWEIALLSERKSAKTIRTYRDGVRGFLRWCADTQTPPVLSRAAVQAFTGALLAAGAEAHTARARQQAVRRFSAWLADEGEIDSDPLEGIKPPKLDTKIAQPLTDDELKLLIKACQGKTLRDRRDEAVVRLMAETGMRAGELVGMEITDVDLVRGMAIIRRGKGGRGRVVPFGPHVAQAIDRYLRVRRSHRLAASPDLWLGHEKGLGTFSYSALQKSLAYRARVAGIDRFHPHLLRHTAATRWLAAGGSEGGLMAVAGWRSREMLDRYVAATAAERAAAEARGLNLGDL